MTTKLKFKEKKFQAVETFTMLLSFWWFIVLILPQDTFSTSHAYDAMKGIAGEVYWSLQFLIISFIQFAGMLLDCKKIKKFGLILSMGIWMFVAATLFLGSPTTTAAGTCFLISILCGWLYVKVGEQR